LTITTEPGATEAVWLIVEELALEPVAINAIKPTMGIIGRNANMRNLIEKTGRQKGGTLSPKPMVNIRIDNIEYKP
jgi:hypothetical protein